MSFLINEKRRTADEKHSFEFPADQLGRPGAVKAYRGNKNDYVTPVADLSGMAELLTNTPLEAIEVYSQFGQDRLGAVLIDRAQGWAYSDRDGTLFIEESEDNNSWTASHSVAVKGGVLTASGWVSLTKRYYRFRFENGNQKQSEFVLYQSVGTGGDMAFSYTDVIFHENAAEAGEGSIFSAGAWKNFSSKSPARLSRAMSRFGEIHLGKKCADQRNQV